MAMENNLVTEIKNTIEKIIRNGKRKFIIFPFGDVGMQVKNILNEVYGITDVVVLDNHLCEYNRNIKPIAYLSDIDVKSYGFILASTNPDIYDSLKKSICSYIEFEDVFELSFMKNTQNIRESNTKCGKYSYGPLCSHNLVESVGAFCSFAKGTDVLVNHPLNYISTHTMLYMQDNLLGSKEKAEEYYRKNAAKYYPAGLIPTGFREVKKITIGNDVWLGQNVLIANYSNIGNGVIAGAGAVITKDVPDYAVVVGVPAKIIRYRYTKEQIEELNKIQWWN